MHRLRAPRDPVTVHFDGAPLVAERGEPVAVALIAAGHLALARSPKFHRPRGPTCLRAGCDGCLARVDDVPNVMTCRLPAAGGIRIDTQNVVGTRDTDLLRMADWFFPEGMNHHELLAGVPGVQRVVQALARRVAGLGKLPGGGGSAPSGKAAGRRPARRRHADVLIVGTGPAGMASALELARRGRQVELIDDDLAWGGCARALPGDSVGGFGPLLRAFGEAIAASQVVARTRTTAAGIYGDDVLVVGNGGVELVTARLLVLAPGAHDGVLAFEGNDVPGVMSARAACRLLAHGVVIGKKVAVVGAVGARLWGEAYARARPEASLVEGVPVRAAGRSRVKHVALRAPGGERKLECDALLVDAPLAPAYELCAQAGAELASEARGFVVRTSAGGKIRDGVFAAGEVVGTPAEPDAVARHAQALAQQS